MSGSSLRKTALSFFDLVLSGKVRQWFIENTGSDFIHHNQYFKADPETLILAIEEDARNNPEKSIDVKHTLAEGEFVMVVSHVKQNPDDPGFAIMHLFRFVDSLVVEMWDISQAILEDSPNENGNF